MFLLFPLLLVYSLAVKKFSPTVQQRYSPALIGFLFASLYTFIELLFVSAYYLSPYTFFANYIVFFAFEVLIPCVSCFLILTLCVKKQENKFMLLYFVLLGFYTIYFPARIMNRNTIFDWYILFVKPILYASMLLGIKNLITYFYQHIHTAKDSIVAKRICILKFSLALLVSLLIPPAIDVMDLLNLSLWTILFVSLLYSIVPILFIAIFDTANFKKIIVYVKENFKINYPRATKKID